jgi:1-aminocyclopropane-1-carboxylate deaminase/D-cysteine desulfhydrase-like pyridoxal-dependent ACC family enzyme
MNLETLPRVPLGFFPTPLEEMPRLSAALGGPRILVKRDDQTGLEAQLDAAGVEADRIVVASSSFGTQAGMVVGAKATGFRPAITAIAIDSSTRRLQEGVAELAGRTEGLMLDPVYTGRAIACLIDLVRSGVFKKDETIVFWHTGGSAALFAYADQLMEDRKP